MNRKTALFVILLSLFSYAVFSEEMDSEIKTRYGISLISGKTFNPDNNTYILMGSGFILYDYEKIWKHKAPEQLRFKWECDMGSAHFKKMRLVTSVNIFALYYLKIFKNQTIKPYVEGGIGIIYTDFQVRGQGYRVNFNPQIGLGTEIRTKTNNTYFTALRLHHISNGNLDDDNAGIDSAMFMFGYYF